MELLQDRTCNHVLILLIEVDVPLSMLLPSLLMTTEMSWLVKILLNGSINYELYVSTPCSQNKANETCS
jgi:hypothetical protein